MLVLDDSRITGADFLDYLRGLRDFGLVIKEAAVESVEQNQMISERVSAKIDRRANIRNLLLGQKPVAAKKQVKAIDISAIKKEEDGKWNVYDESGKKKLGGPYESESKANERIAQVEHFKTKSSEEIQSVPDDPFTEVEASKKSKITPAEVYTLNGSTNELLVWSKISGGSKVRGYTYSMNVGMQKLAQKTGASMRAAAANSSKISTTLNAGKVKAAEVKRILSAMASRSVDTSEKQLIQGMLHDVIAIENLLNMRSE